MLRTFEYCDSTPCAANTPPLNGLTARTGFCNSLTTTLTRKHSARMSRTSSSLSRTRLPPAGPRPAFPFGPEDDHDVLADLPEPVALAFLEAVAHRHDQYDGATPQAIPAIVRKLRSLLRSRLEKTWLSSS